MPGRRLLRAGRSHEERCQVAGEDMDVCALEILIAHRRARDSTGVKHTTAFDFINAHELVPVENLAAHLDHGLAAAKLARGDKSMNLSGGPLVVVSTAHPAKFPDAVESATGIRPEAPPRLAKIMKLPERLEKLPNRLGSVEDFIKSRARLRGGR